MASNRSGLAKELSKKWLGLRTNNVGMTSELDWIILKALEKSPERRYDSTKQMAVDLDCFLEHQPVQAKPYVLVYLLKRIYRRHRIWIAALGFAALMLLIGIGIGLQRFTRNSQPSNKSADKPEQFEKRDQILDIREVIPENGSQQPGARFRTFAFTCRPHSDRFSCYFTDDQPRGEYVLAYRTKSTNTPDANWGAWQFQTLQLESRQTREPYSYSHYLSRHQNFWKKLHPTN